MFKSFKDKLKGFFKSNEELEETPEKKKEKTEKEKKKEKKEELKKQTEKIQEAIEEKKEELDYLIDQIEEKPKEKPKTGFFKKASQGFSTLTLTSEKFNNFFEELEMLLLENNVALEVVDKIKEDMKQKLVNIEIKKSNLETEIKSSLKESLEKILLPSFDIIEKIENSEGPFVILFFGINGSGKTTSIAKICKLLKENKISSVLAAADTFRAASIEQLKKHGDNLGVKVISQNYGSDPAAVGFDAIQYAKSHGIKTVLIDTAGRMYTKKDLLREMEKIIRVTSPNLKIFVAESITGNDATEQAKAFNESFEIDGSILTKADVDEKGGTAISIGHITNKPILFLGTGQEYEDLEKFDPKEILVKLGLE
jgi:fused signal recognition particle receptor